MKFIKTFLIIFCVLATSIACSKAGSGSDTNPNGGAGSTSTQQQEKDKIMDCLKSESHIVFGGIGKSGDSFKTISLKIAVASQNCAASEQDVIDFSKYLEAHPGEAQ